MTTHTSIDDTTGPHAVKAIRTGLPDFKPVDKSIADPDNITLTFDIVNWTFNPSLPPPLPIAHTGTLRIQRRVQIDEIHYHIEQQTTIGGGLNNLEARITCHPDELNTLKSWEIFAHYENPSGETDPRLNMLEKGQNNTGTLQIQNGNYRYEYHATNPVISQWTPLHFLMSHCSESTQTTFDLLQDLSLFKPNQSLICDGPIQIDVQGNQPLSLQTYAQTGSGIQPIHYLLDNENRPQLITFSIRAWALTDIT